MSLDSAKYYGSGQIVCCYIIGPSAVSLSCVPTEEPNRVSTCNMNQLKSVKQAPKHISCMLLLQPLLFHLSVPFCQLFIAEDNTCKVRYCAKHMSEVKIDASPVNKEWVECPVGARLELLANPSEVNNSRSRYRRTLFDGVAFIILYCFSH